MALGLFGFGFLLPFASAILIPLDLFVVHLLSTLALWPLGFFLVRQVDLPR